jgi:L-ascorbate metabolism protein UlaG (beta-lactamase superfamily)
MKITYYGHGTLGLSTMGKHLIIDPFITPNPLASSINIDELDADYILITHGHQDHVVDVDAIAQRTGATIISNFEIVSWYGEKGFSGHPMNHGGKKQFDFGELKYVNAIHSSVLPDGTYGGNPGGFVISNEEGCIYIAGDTALTLDMKLIPMTSPKLDICVFPIGDNFTMGYEDAIIASDFVECNTVIGCHYNTFGYIEIDTNKAKDAFKAKEKNLILLEIGTSHQL